MLEVTSFKLADQDAYYWCQRSKTIFNFGGPSWEQWNEAMKTGLPKAQIVGDTETENWLSKKTGGVKPSAVCTQPVFPFWSGSEVDPLLGSVWMGNTFAHG